MHGLLKKIGKEVKTGKKKNAMKDLKKAVKKDIVMDKKVSKYDMKMKKKGLFKVIVL